MEIIPALDLLEGKVVRLINGRREKCIVYSENPVLFSRRFRAAGIRRLHVVDLDGAFSGKMKNFEIIRKLISSGLELQAGGGIRDYGTASKLLKAGVKKIVLGTAFFEDKPLVRRLCIEYAGRVVLALDVAPDGIRGRGWLRNYRKNAALAIKFARGEGVNEAIITNISGDGTLNGMDAEFFKRFSGIGSMKLIASGGISSLEDLKILKSQGFCGAIIGRAIYEGKISLEDAIEVGRNAC